LPNQRHRVINQYQKPLCKPRLPEYYRKKRSNIMSKSLALTFSLLLLTAIAGCSAQPETTVEGAETPREHRGSVTDR
jgi:hypothetical protein